jgi:heterogeneous nuclear ribonucleoprotein A1/A3
VVIEATPTNTAFSPRPPSRLLFLEFLLSTSWSRDVNNRKLYIRNLNFETTTESLHASFAAFGDIVDSAVIKDKATGRSKGFGFITYANADDARRALAAPTREVEGRQVSVALAAAGKAAAAGAAGMGMGMGAMGATGSSSAAAAAFASNDVAARKLFVRQLSFDTSDATLQTFFAQYGELQEVFLFRDKETGKSKGHAFVTFLEAASAARALVDPIKTIDGRKAIAKLAIEGMAESQQKQQQQQQQQQLFNLGAAMFAQQSAMMPLAASFGRGMGSGAGHYGAAAAGAGASAYAPTALGAKQALATHTAPHQQQQLALQQQQQAAQLAAQQQQQAAAVAQQQAAAAAAAAQTAAYMAMYYPQP